jgi:hypothetical protein
MVVSAAEGGEKHRQSALAFGQGVHNGLLMTDWLVNYTDLP